MSIVVLKTKASQARLVAPGIPIMCLKNGNDSLVTCTKKSICSRQNYLDNKNCYQDDFVYSQKMLLNRNYCRKYLQDLIVSMQMSPTLQYLQLAASVPHLRLIYPNIRGYEIVIKSSSVNEAQEYMKRFYRRRITNGKNIYM